MSIRWKLSQMIGPLWQLLPPYWRVRVYHRLVRQPFATGVFVGESLVRRVSPHGFRMRLDLDDWMERFAGILGIFYEIEVTEVIQRYAGKGSDFVDIGGNLGFTSLVAASAVGQQGRVIYVEPNPALVSRFRETVRDNGIDQVSIIGAAFGREPGVASLAVTAHHGQSALAPASDDSNAVSVNIIDETSLQPLLRPGVPCFVKIDVEGYEEEVLAGMDQMLDRPNTVFLIELTDKWLRKNGGSADRLWSTMVGHGFKGYLPKLSSVGGALELVDLDRPPADFQSDVLFMRPA